MDPKTAVTCTRGHFNQVMLRQCYAATLQKKCLAVTMKSCYSNSEKAAKVFLKH